MKLHRALVFVVFLGLLIAGCNIPGNSQAGLKSHATFTSAAKTVEAMLTQGPESASVVAETPTVADVTNDGQSAEASETPAQSAATETIQPTITHTPEPTQICDAAEFMDDVTIPDGTIVKTGETFTKTWRFKNIGTCTWDASYTLIFDVGDQMNGPTSVPLPVSVAPGDVVEFSINFQAPDKPGSYRSYWRLRNPSGVMLPILHGYKGKSFYVDIRAKDNPNGVAREFGISNVNFKVSHSGDCTSGTYNVAANVSANGPGEISYTWKRSDGTIGPLSDGKLTFAASGLQVVTYAWQSAATGISVTFSVTAPFQHDFGPALLNCP